MEDKEMIFQSVLLQIFQKLNNERTISSAYHLLRGKRSGQTIQDVGIFHLHNYFGILPKLSRNKYDEDVNKILEAGYIEMNEEGYFQLTNLGHEIEKESIHLPFDGWHYRGNEHLFFARLSLVVQSLSHNRSGVSKFIPLQKDEEIQRWVKRFLMAHHYQNGLLQEKLAREIINSLETVDVEERLKAIVINRLGGYMTPGFTWQQISYHEQLEEIDVQLLYIATLQQWIQKIYSLYAHYPLLGEIAENVRIDIPLTGSALQTAQLFKQGLSIEEISRVRQLKSSTIEDHLVELAMNDPIFPIHQFISDEDKKLVLTAVDDYDTRKLKVLHEVVPHLSYFQLRLVLAKGNDI